MPCYTPLSAYEVTAKKEQKENGKKTILFKRPQHTTYKEVQLPCGQCIGCRLLHSVTWATRIMHELQTTPDERACFITLTYNDKHLPGDNSLNKEHFKDFLKRFRKAINVKIRYFMCGEYGDISWRPHYHAIIFNYDFRKPQWYRKKLHQPRQQMQYLPTENPYYISSFLSELWPFGNHIITNCNFETAAYVARYCVKKITGDKAEEHYNRLVIDWNEYTGEIYNMQEVQLQPEYATMSRAKGIGREWYEIYKDDCYPSNYLIKDGNKIPIPKYYDKLLEKEDEVLYNQVKIERELNIAKRAADLTNEMLEKRHYCKKQQYKQLERTKI